MTAPLRLFFLGTPEIWLNEQPVTAFKTAKERVLFYFLVTSKEIHSRHALAGLLWGERSEEQAKNSLRVALSSLNKLFPNYLTISRQEVSFNRSSDYWFDVENFQASVQHNSEETQANSSGVIELYRGPFLDSVQVDGSPELTEWILAERKRLHQTALRALTSQTDIHLSARAFADAIPLLVKLLDLEPGHEDAHRSLMLAYARLGNFDAALAQYATCCRMLDEQFGVDPMSETSMLYERILAARATPISSLPANSEPFVGRAVELAQLANMLTNPDVRLVTITGFGGIGKTRLALTAAHQISTDSIVNFLNGIVYVPLVGVARAELLALVIAEALGFKPAGDVPVAQQLCNYLRQKETLLVLDNFEHLMDGIDLIGDLLAACPYLNVMLTSREPLQLATEWRLDLDGLPYPQSSEPEKQLTAYESIQLLHQTARGVQPDFQLVGDNASAASRLCQIVGGSPLAIQLATLWLDQLTLPDIVVEVQHSLDILATDLRDWPTRQRSIKAIFDYTYSLLNPEEQSALQHISVFREGFTEEAAAQIAMTEEAASLFTLTGLVDRGFIQLRALRHGLRYEIHELTRQYAAALLDEPLARLTRNRHSRYFAAYAGRYTKYAYGADYRVAVDAIDAELSNVRAAWQWLAEQVDSGSIDADILEQIEQFGPILAYFFQEKASYQEARQAFQEMATALISFSLQTDIAHLLYEQHQMLRARVHIWLAEAATDLGDYAAAQELLLPLLPWLRTEDSATDLARALRVLGRGYVRQGNYAQAAPMLAESLGIFDALGDHMARAQVETAQGVMEGARGNYDKSERLYQAVLARYEATGYTPGIARLLSNIGGIYARQGRNAEALSLYERALPLAESAANRGVTMFVLSNTGGALAGLRRFIEAETYYQRSLALAREMGDLRWVSANLHGLGRLYLEKQEWGDAARALNEGFDVAHAIRSAPDALGNLAQLTYVWTQRGKIEEALRALLFADQHPAFMERDRVYSANLLTELLSELPPAVIEDARAWAQNQSLDDVATWIDATVRSDATS